MEQIKKDFENRMFMYPSDMHYISAIGNAIGLKQDETWRLFSIMGAQELADTLPLAQYRNFQALGDQDLDFRFNLHLHTHYSDGAMTVPELLEQAKQLADARAFINDNLPPFVLAITDHDCIEGAQEAVHIISKAPEKYKNLRLVLGSELGAVWKAPQMQSIPMEYELLAYGLNPFDKDLNSFLALHQERRVNAAIQLITLLQEAYPSVHISYKDACQFEPLLAKNQGLGFAGRIYRYAASKLDNAMENHNLYQLTHQFNHSFMPPENVDPYQDTDDIFALFQKSGFGFLGIAHPQKINVGKFLKPEFITDCQNRGLDAGYELMYQLMMALKSKGLRALEINYQFDYPDMQYAQKMLLGQVAVDENNGSYHWIKFIADFATQYGLLKTGGYDTHKTKITAR